MAGLTIGAICEALKAQLDAHLTGREQTVYAYPVITPSGPSITIEPDGPDFVDYWGTFGEGGVSTLQLILRIDPASSGDPQSPFIRLYDYLSVGTGNNSSVLDAVMVDRTLGGMVGDAFASFRSIDKNEVIGEIAVLIHVNKVGAEV